MFNFNAKNKGYKWAFYKKIRKSTKAKVKATKL
jgi:hypothetical protein